MIIRKALAATLLAALAIAAVPATPAYADGAASTRNIILGGALATYLIIQHNRKVHEKYAADAAATAAASEQANDAWAAYRSERHAYDEQVSVNADLKKEVAYQHSVVTQQQRQLASMGATTAYVAPRHGRGVPSGQVAMTTSYGWGQI
jgi:hypothetical protein